MQTKGTRVLTRIFFLAMLVGVADAATWRGVSSFTYQHDSKLDYTLQGIALEAGVLTRTQAAQTSAMQQASGLMARLNPAGAVQVYVHMQPGLPLIEPVLSAVGLNIELINTQFGIAQGWIAPAALEALSQLPSVSRVTVPGYAFTREGSINTEGDVLLRAHDLRAASPGFTGMGVRVGVISDGIDSLTAAQATGDAPVVATPSLVGMGDEGTAMIEIIHDLAPDAQLGFCGPATDLEFIQCVQDLQVPFGADIIVDDLGFLNQPFFEDGSVAQAVRNAVTVGGVDYVSAAGNSAAGGYYEAAFAAGPALNDVDIDPGPNVNYNAQHDFGAGDFSQSFTVPDGECLTVALQWSNPYAGAMAADDYDLVLFDSGSNVIVASSDRQDGVGGDDLPLEFIGVQNISGADQDAELKVLKFSAGPSPRLKMVASNVCQPFEYSTAAGSIFGHPAVPEAIAVGTINVFQPGLNVIAPYSSQGPVRIDFGMATGMRPKPDITGVDCGSITGAGGFGQTLGSLPNARFCGTSAAAPHVAGVLALLKSTGTYAADEDVDALKNMAVPLGGPTPNNIYGFGRVNAVLAARELVLLATIDSPAADIAVTPGQSLNFLNTCSDPAPAAPAFTVAWDFDDGTMSAVEDPGAKSFDTTGIFDVTLTCTNANGTSTATRQIIVAAASGGGGGGGSGGGGGGGGCFIATAAYGSYLHPRVQVLRDFRDQYLMTNDPGRAFVQWYYQVSPPMAEIIADNEMLRLLARGALTPVVYVVQYPGLGAGLLLLGFIGLRGYRRVLRPETSH